MAQSLDVVAKHSVEQERVLQTAEVVHDLVDTRVDALIAQEVGDAR